ncbi:putative quinol monooxygenase [Cupriavidus lacunae]|uniref:Antibiotic biosynthesis monooxygenase n=1 Tax=Cupriavidus lacunae TaxID=2666307 RepID=A0A370NID2_9BURK|nr:antibiotic biosynthesis monooxygenase family protein [Cupriavidus lacunae]RDK05342.1 antibiotic biosynthesis monooxygenase [Cupriavidus lacunae]
MNESTAFIVHLPGKPEHRAELESKLLYVLDQMSKEPDFINTYLHRSIEDPDTLVLYENWACSEQHFRDHHLKTSYRSEYEAALAIMLKAPRTIEFLTPVRAYQKSAN